MVYLPQISSASSLNLLFVAAEVKRRTVGFVAVDCVGAIALRAAGPASDELLTWSLVRTIKVERRGG
jgi:hypothetical protein